MLGTETSSYLHVKPLTFNDLESDCIWWEFSFNDLTMQTYKREFGHAEVLGIWQRCREKSPHEYPVKGHLPVKGRETNPKMPWPWSFAPYQKEWGNEFLWVKPLGLWGLLWCCSSTNIYPKSKVWEMNIQIAELNFHVTWLNSLTLGIKKWIHRISKHQCQTDIHTPK